jgi:uncharacterized Zn-finger protein
MGIRVAYGTRIVKDCSYCGKQLLLTAGRVTLNNYCSIGCSSRARSATMKGKLRGSDSPYWTGRIDKLCETCGRLIKISPCEDKRGGGRFCSRKCFFIASGRLHGRKSPQFRGGVAKSGGYTLITPKEYLDNGSGPRYIREHRDVVEKSIGRTLSKSEHVHHINGIKNDNRLKNLAIVVKTDHYGEVVCPHCREKFLIK